MKKVRSLRVVIMLLVSILLTSCEKIEENFKVAMFLGIFIIVTSIISLELILMKLGKTNHNQYLNSLINKKMENNSNYNSENGTIKKRNSSKSNMKTSQLMRLFEDELKDILWAEKALTKAIPLMVKNATSIELIEALSQHLEETNKHVERLAEVFEHINKKLVAKKCEAMEGLIKEAGEIMESCEAGAMRDAGIISAAQKVEHYEMATYGTLRQFAKTLGLIEVAELLKATLKEEKASDKKLSEVAISTINIEAAEEEVEN